MTVGRMLVDALAGGAARLDLILEEEMKRKFCLYYELLVEGNSRHNLTAITGELEVAVKHFLDSLACARVLDLKDKYVIDVGSGAGFPGIPLKIYLPDMPIMLIEATRKKAEFISAAVKKLSLAGVEVKWARAEDVAREEGRRDSADVVVSRAVARMDELAAYCLPLVKPGGYFMAMKGPGYEEELARAEEVIEKMGGAVVRVEKITLPLLEEKRTIIVVEKTGRSPEGYRVKKQKRK